jgi:hypothetical protein
MVSGWESLEGIYMQDSKAALDVISHIPTAYFFIIRLENAHGGFARLENAHGGFANLAHAMIS